MSGYALTYIALVARDVDAACRYFGEALELDRRDIDLGGRKIPFFGIGKAAIAVFEPEDRYLDEPNSTKQVNDNGWFLTGDLAYRDRQGRIFLQGRNDDMIKLRDGSWLHPNKLEQLLSKHPEVQDAAVLITDPYSSLIGLIVTEEEPERILNTLKKQHINERLPDKLKRVTSLPYNRNGKLQRSLLPDFVGKD